MVSNGFILLVDDDEDLTEMMQFQLESEGYQVKSASNGKEALRMLNKYSPDLIILDMNMPQMDGLEFFDRICDEDRCTQYPVISLTAEVTIESLFEGFNVDGYLAKPFKMEKLLKMVEFVIRNKKLFAQSSDSGLSDFR